MITKRYNIILIFLLFAMTLVAQQKSADDYYYYYKGDKVYLQVDYSRVAISSTSDLTANTTKSASQFSGLKMSNSKKSQTKNSIVKSAGLNIRTAEVDEYFSEFEIANKLDNNAYSELIQTLGKSSEIIKASPCFTIQGKNLGLSNNFYVKLRDIKDKSLLDDLAKEHSIVVLGYNEFMPLWFTLSCVKESSLNAIEAANLFYESQLFESAEPEFMYHELLSSNDQYFNNQWGLKNTGQYCNTSNIDIRAVNAWTKTVGSSTIKVAVFDQGIKMDHPDLVNNIFGTGYDAETNTTPSVIRGSHGTPCAGIVAAQQNNSIGVSGVAPNVKLISVSLDLTFANTPQQLANGFNYAWQNGADVISNSWGGYSPSSIIENAITNALSFGRSGKGTIVVFASGNEDNTAIRYPGSSIPEILVVGAVSPSGKRKSLSPLSCDGEGWGGCFGTALDVAAPGVFIPTTTYTGGYTLTFNGTSSACPHVAGVAALVLSVNPNLTGQQVRNIIESTAQKIGGYNYQTLAARPNGTWYQEMGYGLVNAEAAVNQAACTVNLSNLTISSNRSETGCYIDVQNTIVQSGAKLTLTSSSRTTFDGPFEVKQGSQLEVK